MKTFLLTLLTTLSLTAQVVYDDGLFQAKSSPLLQGLQGYWRLEEASGTRYDRSKNGNHLTANNSPGNASGVSSATGNCTTFVSSSTQSLSISDTPSLSIVSGTICLWVKFTTVTTDMILVRKNTSGDRGYQVDLDSAGHRIEGSVASGASTLVGVVANTFGAPVTNTWLFVSLWWNSTSVNISVNNGTTDTTAGTGIGRDDGSTLYVGTTGTSSSWLNGSIDEIGIWNRVLSAAERTQLYQSGGGVTHPQFHARTLRDWRRWEPEFPTLAAWMNRKQEVIDL